MVGDQRRGITIREVRNDDALNHSSGSQKMAGRNELLQNAPTVLTDKSGVGSEGKREIKDNF